MLCDVLHTVAKLQGSLLQTTVVRLRELKDRPSSSTWFKDHSQVFSDPKQLGQLEIQITESDSKSFIQGVYNPYIQSVIDHITSRMQSSDVFSAFSIFNPLCLPNEEKDLSMYGSEQLNILTSFYGMPHTISFKSTTGTSIPDVDLEQTEAEWKKLRRLVFTKYKSSTDKDATHALIYNSTLSSSFPNLVTLAKIVSILPVATATVERSFSNMKLVKTKLRSQLVDDTLDQASRVCIEGPERLTDESLGAIIDHWKEQKIRRLLNELNIFWQYIFLAIFFVNSYLYIIILAISGGGELGLGWEVKLSCLGGNRPQQPPSP